MSEVRNWKVEMSKMDRQYSDKLKDLKESYKEELKTLLEESGLSGKVIRKSDGKVGVLQIAYDYYTSFGYEIRFYPYTKKGEVSKNASGYFSFDNFERVEE